jgi:hypothetical protein
VAQLRSGREMAHMTERSEQVGSHLESLRANVVAWGANTESVQSHSAPEEEEEEEEEQEQEEEEEEEEEEGRTTRRRMCCWERWQCLLRSTWRWCRHVC